MRKYTTLKKLHKKQVLCKLYLFIQSYVGKEQKRKASVYTIETETRQTGLCQCAENYIGLK